MLDRRRRSMLIDDRFDGKWGYVRLFTLRLCGEIEIPGSIPEVRSNEAYAHAIHDPEATTPPAPGDDRAATAFLSRR